MVKESDPLALVVLVANVQAVVVGKDLAQADYGAFTFVVGKAVSITSCLEGNEWNKTCVPSMIHSAEPKVPPVAITILAWKLFCFVRFWNSMDMLDTTGSDYGLASWINFLVYWGILSIFSDFLPYFHHFSEFLSFYGK